MDVTHSDIYSRALSQAKAELENLRADFERISRRKSQLEAFIANTEPLVPTMVPTLDFPAPVVQKSPPSPKVTPVPIWRSIVLSINEKGDSFSVKDALDALERIGRPVDSPNRFQIVRNVLTKKLENFEQIGPGLFSVRKGKREKEVIPEEKTS